MKKSRKILAFLLAVVMLVGMTACAKGGGKAGGGASDGGASQGAVSGENSGKENGAPAEIKGETYETSLISALCPEGWMAFHKADFFEEYPDEPGDPHGLRIHKGAKEELDQLSTPGIQVDYYPEDTEMYDSKEFYEDAKELEPFTTGDYTWEGFSATSAGMKLMVLTVREPYQLEVTIFPELGDQTISLDDADVQAILSSITVK